MRSPKAEERLAIAQAVYKLAAREVSTKAADNTRAEMDAETLDLYEHYGVKSRDVKLGGVKVGSLGVNEKWVPVVVGQVDFDSFARSEGWIQETAEIDISGMVETRKRELLRLVEEHFPEAVHVRETMVDWAKLVHRTPMGDTVTEDGEAVPGVDWVRQLSTTLRGCEPEKVAEAMGAIGGPSIFALLDGGGE